MLTQVYFSHKYQLNYLLIPKTGSTTVRTWLGCISNKFWHHAQSGLQYDYTLFTVIRDPYSRFLSGYNEARRINATQRTILETLELGKYGVFRDRHLYPQSWWITEAENAGLQIRYFLECDDTLCDQLAELTGENNGHLRLNPSNKQRKLTNQQRELIKEVYKEDFELYEYARGKVGKKMRV